MALLKPDVISSAIIKNTSSRWVCLSCRSRSHLQLRKASSAAVHPFKPSHPPKPKAPTEAARKKTEAEEEAAREAARRQLAHIDTYTGEAFDPTRKLSIADRDDLKRPPLPVLDRFFGSDTPPKVSDTPVSKYVRFTKRYGADYWSREAHGERKRKIYYELNRGYFQDIHLMRYYKGKKFIAPTELNQPSMAKYFPNLTGYTLADPWGTVDTTRILLGKISIVNWTTQLWSQMQVDSFLDGEKNPALADLMTELEDEVGLQRVAINYETEFLKRTIIYMCLWYARKTAKTDLDKQVNVYRVGREYIERELTLTNLRCGHVFLVDGNCKIRWVGMGYANDAERASLVTALRSLVNEQKMAVARKNASLSGKSVERKPKALKPLSSMMTM